MRLYLDTDVWMALIRQEDRFNTCAKKWMQENKEKHTFVTSTVSCIEIWFCLYRDHRIDVALESVRAIARLATVLPIGLHDIQQALVLAEDHKLSPAYALHAVLGLQHDGIVSSDKSFDKVSQLKRIDFTL